MEIRLIILAIIVLILVCIMAGFSCVLRELKEKYDELFVTSQRLVDVVKDIDGDLTGGRYCYRANLVNSSQLKADDTSLNSVVNILKYDIKKLKEADENQKELEIIAERKERMSKYILTDRSNNSHSEIINTLYNIANGIEEDKE